MSRTKDDPWIPEKRETINAARSYSPNIHVFIS